MPVKTPRPGDLEPIETASRDEIGALQLERLKTTLAHAYRNVPHYRKAFDAQDVHPDDLNSLADIARFPFTTKKDLRDNYPFGMFAVPREQVLPHPCVVGHDRQAHGRRLHPTRHRQLGRSGRPFDPRCGRPCR